MTTSANLVRVKESEEAAETWHTLVYQLFNLFLTEKGKVDESLVFVRLDILASSILLCLKTSSILKQVHCELSGFYG